MNAKNMNTLITDFSYPAHGQSLPIIVSPVFLLLFLHLYVSLLVLKGFRSLETRQSLSKLARN